MMKFLHIIAPWVLILAGLVFSGFGLNMVLFMQSFQKKAVRVSGRVVGVNVGVTKYKSEYYSPIVSFQTEEDQEITFQSSIGYSKASTYPVGSPIEVLYSKNNPRKAYVNDFKGLWSAPLLLLGLGLVFLIWGLLKFSGRF